MSAEEGRSWRHCIITHAFEVDGQEYTDPTREGVRVAGTCDCCDKAKIVVNYSSANPEMNNPSTLLPVGGKNARMFNGLLVSAAGIVLLAVAVIKNSPQRDPNGKSMIEGSTTDHTGTDVTQNTRGCRQQPKHC